MDGWASYSSDVGLRIIGLSPAAHHKKDDDNEHASNTNFYSSLLLALTGLRSPATVDLSDSQLNISDKGSDPLFCADNPFGVVFSCDLDYRGPALFSISGLRQRC